MDNWKTPASLEKRDLDGIYLRVCIGDKWDNRCLTDLVWEDVEAWLTERGLTLAPENRERLWLTAARHLHERLRAIGDQLDLTIKTY